MNAKLIVSAAAAAVALCGCATESTSDFNNGPYAEYGFTYDYVLSPIAPLSVDDAEAVMALPSSYVPAVFVHRSHDVNVYIPTATAPANAPMAPGAIQNVPGAPTPAAAPQ